MHDFPDNILSCCPTKFIFRSNFSNNSQFNEFICDLKIKDSKIISDLKYNVNYKFGDILFQSYHGKGNTEAILNFQINSYVMWLITSTSEDIIAKEILAKKVGLLNAIKLLAKNYPLGTIKTLVEKIKVEAPTKEGILIIEDLVKNLH